MPTLEGKVAVVTGATSGIGAAIASQFVADGAKVVIAGRRLVAGEALAKQLGVTARFIRTDVANEADVKAMIDDAVSHFGRLDCLVNNAGIAGPICGIAETNMADYDSAMAVLLRGVFMGIRYAAPVMMAQGSGSIINIASIAAHRTGYGGHTYSAAKAAVAHLTRSTAMELGEKNVRVNTISPGGILTRIFGKAFGVDDNTADSTSEALADDFATLQPIPRAGRPVDIARAAVWLASDASSFVNGHDLLVDGGVIGGIGFSASGALFAGIGAKVMAAAGK